MRAHIRAHTRQHIYENAHYESTGRGHKSHSVASRDHILEGNVGTCYKSHFVWKFTGKVPDPDSGQGILCGNLQEKTHMDISQGPFCVDIYRKKRSWTLHKSHFVWKFTGKMLPAQVPTSIKHGAFYCYRKNPFSVATLFGE